MVRAVPGLVGSREVGGVCKTMLCFSAEELTDASGAISPCKLHPSVLSDELVMEYSDFLWKLGDF